LSYCQAVGRNRREKNQMPSARSLYNHRRVIGKFPSVKMKRMVHYRTLLELDFLYLLDYSPTITGFSEQPPTIEYTVGRKVLTYTPGFIVVSNGQEWLYECLRDEDANRDENARRFSAARAWCEEKNWTFQIAKASDIRSGCRLKNIKYLTGFARSIVSPVVRSKIYSILLENPKPFRIIDIVALIPQHSREEILPTIFSMAFHHKLYLPIDDAPLSPITPISLIN